MISYLNETPLDGRVVPNSGTSEKSALPRVARAQAATASPMSGAKGFIAEIHVRGGVERLQRRSPFDCLRAENQALPSTTFRGRPRRSIPMQCPLIRMAKTNSASATGAMPHISNCSSFGSPQKWTPAPLREPRRGRSGLARVALRARLSSGGRRDAPGKSVSARPRPILRRTANQETANPADRNATALHGARARSSGHPGPPVAAHAAAHW